MENCNGCIDCKTKNGYVHCTLFKNNNFNNLRCRLYLNLNSLLLKPYEIIEKEENFKYRKLLNRKNV